MIRWRLGSTNPRKVSPFKKGLSYASRLVGFAKMQKQMGARIIGTTESGQYVDGERFSNALSWGGVRSGTGNDPDFVLHGDDAGDITNALHWDDGIQMLESFKYSTGSAKESGNHNWGTGALVQDRATGVFVLVICHHAYWETRGKTAPSKPDLIREKHTVELIKGAKAKAAEFEKKHKIKKLPIVFVGDFNQDKDDFYDGVGKAMLAAGFRDAENVARKKKGPETTYPNLPPLNPSTRRLDRIFVPSGTDVTELITVEGPPYTDHNGVAAVVTLSND